MVHRLSGLRDHAQHDRRGAWLGHGLQPRAVPERGRPGGRRVRGFPGPGGRQDRGHRAHPRHRPLRPQVRDRHHCAFGAHAQHRAVRHRGDPARAAPAGGRLTDLRRTEAVQLSPGRQRPGHTGPS
ncbi:hypothetical protein MICRO8M_80343 [Microbacterium sp. 8M]|nr:hypothetical protein MICRO8M_80343 [Microbacterium sp. 8M]